MQRPHAQRPGRRFALAPLWIAALAFVIRALPVRNVFIDGQVYFTDSDSYYHLRRIVYNLASFPNTIEHDLYLNFPDGGRAIWPQALDWMLGVLVSPVYAIAGEQGVERVLVWVPPLVGSLTVYWLYRIAERHVGQAEAAASALVLSVLSAHFWYSQIGFLDHHVVVAFCATLLFGSALSTVDACDRATVERAALVRKAVTLGVLMAWSLLVWPGAILYVALAQVGLLGVLVLSPVLASRHRAGAVIGIANAVALVGVAPFSVGNDWPQWGPYSAVVLSNFQPWFFFVTALLAAVKLQLLSRPAMAGVAARIAASIAIGGVLVGISLLALPGLEASVLDSAQWLGRTDAFQAMVGESMPLFRLHGAFTTQIASSRLSFFIYLFPVVIVALAYRFRDHERRALLLTFVAWAVVLFVFTLMQKRFFNTFSVMMALTMGITCVEAYRGLVARAAIGERLALYTVLCASLALLAPSLWVYKGPAVELVAAAFGEAPPRNGRIDINVKRRAMASWLRENTPETSGFIDASLAPEYGVLARWGEGHFIKYTGRRPSVMGNFGDDLGREHFLLARSYFEAAPERASEILETLRVRYVVIRSAYESRPMARALFDRDGSRLGRYRLLHEVAPLSGTEVPSYKIFEFVKGAQLEGSAAPRSLVRVELRRVSNLGRSVRFEMVTEADRSGRYRVRLPYATASGGIGAQGGTLDLGDDGSEYLVSSGGEVRRVAIEEASVQNGDVVSGPNF